VVLRLADGSAAAITGKINTISAVEKSILVSDSPLTVRAFPRRSISGDELARAVGEVAVRERWQLQELHTEEGRLDEVFRSITLPDSDTAKEEKE
jgi:ABC-2 type transport system ATP-binding protein